ncbi:hypothetical protein PENSPDRAFT_694082 [Peniophora sp. CONT]|nr:hypothetical protein PENSPDRAFT_694082 [Peniophora sp. CONT]
MGGAARAATTVPTRQGRSGESSYDNAQSGFCESIRRTAADGDEIPRDDDENANNNVERGNDDDELPIDDDENEEWNFDLMSATAYGYDLD